MDAVNNLLDKARETCSPATDKALAAKLGCVKSAVSNWRHGRAYPDTVACARIADLIGEPLPRVLGIVGEARAISADEKRVWRRLAAAAAIAAVALCAIQIQPQRPSLLALADSAAPTMHIMFAAVVAALLLMQRRTAR